MSLFPKQRRFVSEEACEKNRAEQVRMAPQTVAQLHAIGVAPGAPLRLEYFFYSNKATKGAALAAALATKGYSSECRPAADGSASFCITGWSTPIAVRDADVVAWADEMCSLGFEHDCEFDGWGTTPHQ
jgi:hypothetical protein